MSSTTVSGKELRVALEVLAPMADRSGYTFVLSAIRMAVTADAATLFATDRYRIGEWALDQSDADGEFTALIPAFDVKRILFILPTFRVSAEDSRITISTDGDRITIENERGDRVVTTQVKGDYPALAHLFSAEKTPSSIQGVSLDPKLLADTSAAARRIAQWDSGFGKRGLRLTFGAVHKPVGVAIEGLDRFRALLMPMRSTLD